MAKGEKVVGNSLLSVAIKLRETSTRVLTEMLNVISGDNVAAMTGTLKTKDSASGVCEIKEEMILTMKNIEEISACIKDFKKDLYG